MKDITTRQLIARRHEVREIKSRRLPSIGRQISALERSIRIWQSNGSLSAEAAANALSRTKILNKKLAATKGRVIKLQRRLTRRLNQGLRARLSDYLAGRSISHER